MDTSVSVHWRVWAQTCDPTPHVHVLGTCTTAAEAHAIAAAFHKAPSFATITATLGLATFTRRVPLVDGPYIEAVTAACDGRVLERVVRAPWCGD